MNLRVRAPGCSLLLLILTLLVPGPALALNPDRSPSQYLYDRYGREHGLPSDTVWVARQDNEGYLWLGTKNGLARFDGVKFTLYNKQTHPEFQSNDVRDIEIAADGSLWLATYGGGALRLAAGIFTPLTKSDGLADDVVHDIHISSGGAVWFATALGISRLRDGTVTSWTREDGLADNSTFRLGEDRNGDIWVGTLTNGLSHFDGETFRSYSEGSGLDSTQVHLLFDDPELGLVATTITGSSYRLEPDGPHLLAGPVQAQLPWHSAVRDRDGNLWLGSYGRGLWRLSPEQRLEEIPLTTSQPGYIFELTEDREGNIWASTMQGAYRLRDSNFLQFGQPEGLADPIFVVTQSPVDDAIWAGSEGSGLFRLGPDGSVRQFGTEQGLSNINVSALLVEADNTVWAGTFGGGLNRIASDDSISHFTVDDGLPNNHVTGLTRSRNGRLWVAANGGLGYRDAGTGKVFEPQRDLPETLFRQVMEDSRGDLWIASNSGLIRLQDGEPTLWDSNNGLGSSLISTTYEDADGVLWIGSREAGLARLEGDRLFQYGHQHGLPQLSVLAILEDDEGTLWMSGADGLVTASRAELNAVARGEAARVKAQLYDEADGLRSAQFLGGFQPAGWRARDGRLWFASNRGLVAVDPTDFKPAAPLSRPLIEQVRVNGEAIALAQPLLLPADAHTLEVDYAVPRLGNPQAVRFRYQLEGFDRGWQDVAGRRTAYFTGLTAGEKILRIAAHLEDNVFDPGLVEQQVSLQIYREPYWYQTWWFLVLACAALGLALLGIYRFAIHQASRRQRRLELLVGRRTRELQIALSKVEEISRIDSLTGVANRRFLDENLDKAWRQCAAKQVPVSVIMLDLDFFKQYNDSTGHQAGDDCLRRVAESLQSGVLREGDLIARYGGEEFIALLPGANSAAALAGAQRIHNRIRALQIPHPDSPISDFVSVSVGTATAWPGSTPGTPDLLMQRADRALYAAKSSGRDRVSVWEDSRVDDGAKDRSQEAR